MKVVKELTQGILLNYFAIRNRPFLAISMLTFFDLETPDTALSEQEMWPFVAKELGESAILDAAMPKAKAEVLLHAACFTPNGLPLPACPVGFTLGEMSKTLHVSGKRLWKRRADGLFPTEPKPFTSLPLIWQNAFGGEGFAPNPLGRGFRESLTPWGEPVRELPLVEDPANRMGAPTDTPPPAGFLPIDLTWPQRAKKAGTYDAAWFREHWPYFPEDMDWTFFNTAPEDQQQDTFFTGGEPLTLTHMHPEKPILYTRLPTLRQRIFVHQAENFPDPGSEFLFREVKTQCDTLWLFPHSLKGILIHRGVLEVADEEALDVRHLFLVTESQEEAPKDLPHYREALIRRLDRSVQVDLSQMDAAMTQAGEDLKKVRDIPKQVRHQLEVLQKKAPNPGISPENAGSQCIRVLEASQARMDTAAEQLGRLKKEFGHMVRIDLRPLEQAKQRFEALKDTIRKQLTMADTLSQRAETLKKELQEKTLSALDRPQTRKFIPEVQAQMAPAPEALWPKEALEWVRQAIYDLSLAPEALDILRRMGLRPVMRKRAMLGLIPEKKPFVPEDWGLDPSPEFPAFLPAGLLLAAHEGPDITRIRIRPQAFDKGEKDVEIPGSGNTAFTMGLSPDKALVRVADPLEAFILEQDAGDFVGLVALEDAGSPMDDTTETCMKEAPRLLILLYGADPEARDLEFAPWKKKWPQAEPLLPPEKSGLFDAHEKGVDLEAWIWEALGPAAIPHLSEDSPFRAKKGADAAGLSLPLVDAKGLYAASEQAMKARMAPMLARSEALKKELKAKAEAALEKARDQLRQQGLNPDAHLPAKLPDPPPGPKGFMEGMDLPAKFQHVRGALAKTGQLTPAREADLSAQEARMTELLDASKARWAKAQAEIPGKKAAFAFPDWAKKLLEPFHINPDDTEAMTREKVEARYAQGLSLKGKNLSGLDLSGICLKGADLRGVQLEKSSLAGADLNGADLSGVLAKGADFSGVSFRDGRAVQALMEKALFAGADLSGTDCSKALMKGADLSGANLSGCRLEQTLLEGASLRQADLSRIQAPQGYFMGADLEGASLRNAEAKKAVFLGIRAEGADFSEATLTSAIFWDAQADGATFQKSDLENARFGGRASVQKGDFSEALLDRASLMDTSLSGANFTGARMQHAYIRNCDLSHADLSRVRAEGSALHRSNLEGARVSRSNLHMASLRKARLVHTDLSRSNLFGAECYGAVLGKTDFTETNLKMTLLQGRTELLDDEK